MEIEYGECRRGEEACRYKRWRCDMQTIGPFDRQSEREVTCLIARTDSHQPKRSMSHARRRQLRLTCLAVTSVSRALGRLIGDWRDGRFPRH